MQGRSDDQRELLDAESVAGHLLKGDSVFAFLAAHRHELFPEEMFADLFPSRRGRPSVPAEVMASVITLQALHGFSDSETVEAVTFDLRWKAACGLPITAGAFHSTTLTYWRRRLAASDRPDRIFEAVKAVVAQTGVLAGRPRRALDSTVLDDAVATQDTVTQLVGAIRRVGREVPGAAQVIVAHCTAHDYADPGKPAIAWNDKQARDELVDALVGDAHRLLGHLPEQELGPRAAEAVALLALVAGQDQPYVGLLAWPNLAACRQLMGQPDAGFEAIVAHPAVRDAVRRGLAAHNATTQGASSRRIGRALLLAEPPSIDGNELTDKGYINQRAVLTRRAAAVAVLEDDGSSEPVGCAG